MGAIAALVGAPSVCIEVYLRPVRECIHYKYCGFLTKTTAFFDGCRNSKIIEFSILFIFRD